jgi:site-specific recombinase XerD
MNTLSTELDRYLALRRGLGYDLRTSERVLRKFISFAEQERAGHVTTDLFLRWQKVFGHAHRGTWAARLGMVRKFTQWLHGVDERHEVPPQSLIPSQCRRPRPYIYSETEIQRMINAAADLRSVNGIRGLTYAALFGLIAVTGLRVSEAIALDVGDVDLESGVLTIRRGKLDKERLVPVSNCTRSRLAAYANERDRLLGRQPESFFVADQGDRPTDCTVRYNFAIVCKGIGLRPAQRFHRHGRGPRIHDLRHTFAVHTMLNWYRTGKDVSREMIQLTTYLGHAKPAHTYWYIEAVPELLELASSRSQAALDKGVRA